MASIEQLIGNVEKIRKYIGVYLAVKGELSPKQKAALATNLGQLDRNLNALRAALVGPAPVAVIAPVEPPAVAALVEKVPNFGDSPAMSSGLYGEWVSEWVQRTFPEAYRDWPPKVYAITPQALHDAAVRDGCLAQVTACGNFSFPGGPTADLGDFSLYTALTSTMTDDGRLVHNVWHMGQLVGTQEGGDGLEFAHSLGFDW